jgi:hypothetical protein
MENVAPPLHPPVVTQRSDAAIEKKSAAHGNAAFAEAFQCLQVRRLNPEADFDVIHLDGAAYDLTNFSMY